MLMIRKSPVPPFEQIVAQMKQEIIEGVYSTSEPVPSVRALSAQLGVNPNTVQKAYGELIRLGYLIPCAGTGNYIPDNIEEVQRQENLSKLTSFKLTLRQMKQSGIEMADIIKTVQEVYTE